VSDFVIFLDFLFPAIIFYIKGFFTFPLSGDRRISAGGFKSRKAVGA
jgi:hypothetical protein